MNCAIEMFSKAETKVFGIAMLAFVLSTLFLFLAITAAEKLYQAKHPQRDSRAERWYELEHSEFNEIGKAALNQQRMKSFIAETSGGRMIEVFNVEVKRD